MEKTTRFLLKCDRAYSESHNPFKSQLRLYTECFTIPPFSEINVLNHERLKHESHLMHFNLEVICWKSDKVAMYSDEPIVQQFCSQMVVKFDGSIVWYLYSGKASIVRQLYSVTALKSDSTIVRQLYNVNGL